MGKTPPHFKSADRPFTDFKTTIRCYPAWRRRTHFPFLQTPRGRTQQHVEGGDRLIEGRLHKPQTDSLCVSALYNSPRNGQITRVSRLVSLSPDEMAWRETDWQLSPAAACSSRRASGHSVPRSRPATPSRSNSTRRRDVAPYGNVGGCSALWRPDFDREAR